MTMELRDYLNEEGYNITVEEVETIEQAYLKLTSANG